MDKKKVELIETKSGGEILVAEGYKQASDALEGAIKYLASLNRGKVEKVTHYGTDYNGMKTIYSFRITPSAVEPESRVSTITKIDKLTKERDEGISQLRSILVDLRQISKQLQAKEDQLENPGESDYGAFLWRQRAMVDVRIESIELFLTQFT